MPPSSSAVELASYPTSSALPQPVVRKPAEVPSAASQRFSRWLSMGRESLWVAVGQGSAALAGVVGIRLLAERMSPEDYGRLALAMTFASLAQHVAISPICGAVVRHYSAALEADRLGAFRGVTRKLIERSIAIQIVIGIIAGVLLYGCGLGNWALLAVAATAFSVTATLAEVLRAIPVAARLRPRAALHLAAGHWGRVILAALLVTGSVVPAAAALGGYAAASLLMALSLSWYWARDRRSPLWQLGGTSKAQEELRSQLVLYLVPIATCGVFLWVQAAAPRWALKAFCGDAAVGQYAALFQLGWYPVMLFGMLCMELSSPWLFRMAGDGSDAQRLARSARWNTRLVAVVIACSLIGTGLAWLSYDWVFALIAQASYQVAAPLLPLMVLAAGLHTAAETQSLRLWTAMRTRSLLAPKIWTAAATVLLSSAGAMLAGMQGVVIGQVITAGGYLIAMVFATNRCRHVAPPPVGSQSVASQSAAPQFQGG